MEVLDPMAIPATKLLTVLEVARWLAVSPSWVRDHATGRRRPVLPSIKLGKSLRFDPVVVAEWLQALHRIGKVA
jgi:predicted DNA-binding transcriptional regulator AlpA